MKIGKNCFPAEGIGDGVCGRRCQTFLKINDDQFKDGKLAQARGANLVTVMID